jgi:hypothetical protein
MIEELGERRMGKSIVHCAVCGKAVREEDFTEGKAATIDHRTYCLGCIPAEVTQAQRPSPRKGSTSRLSSAAPITRRALAGTPRTPALMVSLAIGAGVVLIALLGYALSRDKDWIRAGAQEKKAPEVASQPEAPSAPISSPAPESKNPSTALAARSDLPDPRPEPPPKIAQGDLPGTPEKPKSLNPTINSPADGAAFDAPAAIVISVDVPGEAVKVEFYEGLSKIGEAVQRPYSLAWKEVPPGDYRLTVQAKGKDGETRTSLPVSIRVNAVIEAVPEARKPAPAPTDPGIDPRRVDEAIAKGVAFLKASAVKESMNPAALPGLAECPELILWTLVHARVPENDPDFVKLFNHVVGKKMERTYAVALQAMILEEMNRVKYQVRIAQCAQFLMDAQCGNGQWTYTGPAQIGVPTTGLKSEVATSGGAAAVDGSGLRIKPKVVRKITTIRKMQEGPPTGDNSNSQYAALGLRACHDAGIIIPKAVVLHAQTWWRISQHDEELKEGEKRAAVSTGEGVAAAPAGWCYGPKDHGHTAYSSMTAGAVGSVAIWNYLQDEKNWKKDPTLQKGMSWLDRHFTVKGNDGPSEHIADTRWMLYYYLYALERAGVLAATETFGPHKWYREGAEAILGAQRPGGSWLAPLPHGDRSETTNEAWDTCFAILFLKRATRPLDVASTDVRGAK